MFITPAFAQTGGAGGGDFFLQLMPILLMIVIFYFLLFRPQQQRMKVHREMVENIRRGDTVVTAGGLIGKVTRVKDDGVEIEVEIADKRARKGGQADGGGGSRQGRARQGLRPEITVAELAQLRPRQPSDRNLCTGCVLAEGCLAL